MVKCPAHPDKTASLSISEGRDGRVVLKCHANTCTVEAILTAANLQWSDLFSHGPERDSDEEWTPAGAAVAVYRYTDEDGHLLFEVLRTAEKRFIQRRPDSTRKGGWDWRLGDVRRPVYRLPEVLEAIHAGQTIFVTEGEKDVEAIRRTGSAATCNPHGAGKWRKEHAEALRDADVVVIADRDEPGYKHARAVVKSLDGIAQRVRLTESKVGKDAADHLAAGLPLEELTLLDVPKDGSVLFPDFYEFMAGEDSYDWVVEGLLERGDRLLLTGNEGLGKSMLIRQLAVCCAAGVNPFRFERMAPLRVLLVDCENSERSSRRKFAPLQLAAERMGCPVPRGAFYPHIRPGGIDLTDEENRSWLIEQAVAHRPDIAFIGPLYLLHDGNINDEQLARVVARTLDDVREKAGCAVITEAHSGKGDSERDRGVRPIGSSLWLRWPEFGYGLMPTKDTKGGSPLAFQPWRGPRDERDWPDSLERGSVSHSPWPWMGKWLRRGTSAVTRKAEREDERIF